MKNFAAILLLVVVQFGCTETSVPTKTENSGWNDASREKHLANRNDSTTWDLEMLENDKQMIGLGDFGPFELGVFPVPRYDLIGKDSFKGLGNMPEDFITEDRKLVMNSFYVGKNELNKNRIKQGDDAVFFQIIVLTDTIDDVNYNLQQSIGISRNHPDYFGQGFVQTKKTRIDYSAFQTAENTSYAIVNTRVFDLKFGKTIVIAPQKDGTLKSLQIKSPNLSSKSIVAYTKKLIATEKMNAFLEAKGTI